MKASWTFSTRLLISSSLLVVGIVSAHNAGYIIFPDGTCLNVGSLQEALYVPESNPNRNSDGQFDLIPGSGDQYGALCSNPGQYPYPAWRVSIG